VLPILVYDLTESAALTALLVAFEALPCLVFGLPAGAVADQFDRRRIMVICEIANAATLTSIPIAAAFGALTASHVLLVAALSASLYVWSTPPRSRHSRAPSASPTCPGASG
jgi:MFS family permease